jgi:CPA2 family monovalent cation:H+ antiporter-2
LAIASIHEKRDEIRHALQDAAQKAGLTGSHAVKGKTPKARSAG